MNNCEIKCTGENAILQKLTIMEAEKICKLLPKFKTFKDVENGYKTFQKIKSSLPYKKYNTCMKKMCGVIDYKKDLKFISSTVKFIISMIPANKIKECVYWNDIETNINKLVNIKEPNEDDLIKLSYYIIILGCLIK